MICLFLCVFSCSFILINSSIQESCFNNNVTVAKLDYIIGQFIPDLNGKYKGDAGKIGVIGGSIEYTGAPYFAAISSLKGGADLVYVITTEDAAPVIKSYSPDLIVSPFLNFKSASRINTLLQKMDLIIIGPGLGREDETIRIITDIITTCKSLQKPIVIDADGLYIVSKDPIILKDYPAAGVILTPNKREANKLMLSTQMNSSTWHTFWGAHVSVLLKGETDKFLAFSSHYDWSSSLGGSGRRAAGQGDILAGFLGTFYNWALKHTFCVNSTTPELSQSVAAYAAAKLTRSSNSNAYAKFGRSMVASNMIECIHTAFMDTFI